MHSGALIAVWVMFNIIVCVVFGVLHQGGVVPSLLAVGTTFNLQDSSTIIYFHTYMPPTFLSRQAPLSTCSSSLELDRGRDDMVCINRWGACMDTRIIDLKDADAGRLIETLQQELRCSDTAGPSSQHVLVAAPHLHLQGKDALVSFSSDCTISGYICTPVWRYSPHLTTEDFPPLDWSLSKLFNALKFNIYEVSCSL